LPEASIGWGLDGVAWVKEGLVDILVLTARWATADFDIPVDRWRKLLGDTPVALGEKDHFVLVQDPDGTIIELIGPLK
jgi:hypothetical protein